MRFSAFVPCICHSLRLFPAGAQFTGFTGTKVLVKQAFFCFCPLHPRWLRLLQPQVLNLLVLLAKVLALLVQKYKYWRKSVSHARQLLFRRCLLRQYLYFCTSKIR
jgi:hypothetical protein